MEFFFSLCGFMFAHTVWSINDGSILTPMGFKANEFDSKSIERFVDEKHYENSAKMANVFLDEQSKVYKYTAIYFDGFYTYPNGEKIDSLYMIARINENGSISEITMALPYQKKKLLRPFKVYRPKLIGLNGIKEDNMEKYYEYFWNGIEKHPQGSKTWNKAIDQSK